MIDTTDNIALVTADLWNCHIYDSVLLLPLTDQLVFGGDMLVVAGSVTIVSTSFTSNIYFGSYGGVGLTVAVLGGVVQCVASAFISNGVALSNHGPGTVIFVGGKISRKRAMR
jgi:uncharacterized membrane protein YvlD (DUF360 family)